MESNVRPRVSIGARMYPRNNRATRRGRGMLVAASLLLLVACAAPGAASAAPGGHLWWDTVFNVGGAGDESAAAVTADAAGYPIIAGTAVTAAAGDPDIRYRSYDLSGLLRWNAVGTTWPSPSAPGLSDRPAGVVVDDARNAAYVAGTTRGATTGNDVVVLRVLDVDPGGPFSGDLVWSQVYNATPGRDDEAEAVALDKHGNVYVTGGTERADGSMDVLTVKFRPSGAVAWMKRHNSPGARLDRGLAIAVRGTAVYVAGISNRSGHGDDLVLLRYSLSGKRAWVRYYDDPLHRHEMLTGLAATSGAVYLSGSGKARTSGGGDALLVKYRADGKRLWARYVKGSGGGYDAWSDVAVDAKGRVHVTGFLDRNSTGDDIVTRMYTSAGKLLWQAGFSSSGAQMDLGSALALDGSGRTYVCGRVTGLTGDVDGVVLGYSTTGQSLWHSVYPDPTTYALETDSGDDWFEDIAVAGSHVYAVGRQTIDHTGVVDADLLTVSLQR